MQCQSLSTPPPVQMCAAIPGKYSLKRQLPPELARLVRVLGNAGTLTVELVVLGANKLLGALGAVVALAGGAEGGSGALGAQGHARGGRAGEHALSEHVGGGVEWRFGGWSLVVVVRVRFDEVELTSRSLAVTEGQATRKLPVFALFVRRRRTDVGR
jgi:hypothetical protein